MKKVLLTPFFFLTLSPLAYAQCEPVALPYTVTAEAAAPPALPECMVSNYEMFSSSEVFKTIVGPVAGFEGNVLAYNTVVNSEFMDPSTLVGASLYTRSFELQPGVNYTVSYKYGNSGANQAIDNVYVSVVAGGTGSVNIATHENITGAVPVSFTSQPFTVTAAGTYNLAFGVSTTGSQGFFYLDDIVVQETGGAIGAVAGHNLAAVSAYPNPAKNVINITGSVLIDSVTLFSATGQKVVTQQVNNTSAAVNIEALAAGIYILNAEANGSRQTLKIVKE
jgi:Secretion system C-terminal sorting domain